ncbi:SET domain-containing protein [Wolfiporia cocos MD-104 SS10]|uniref:SET domain-containing protein n=1 Tax=Wolfiporia cocos (strain MD-104) TaxID=742152 RepID=A0A2H3K9I5_WOLCO|nr:SET domain-containing protein [Wolfiporia cocos MD-104 SS10]
MSFASLRSSRQSKEAKSFVKRSTDSVSSPITTDRNSSNVVDDKLPSANSAYLVHYDGLHKALPPTLEIRTSSGSGRGLYAKKTLKAGFVLAAATPHVNVLSTSYLDSYCSNCCGPAPQSGLKRCTKCRTVWYCSSKCQTNDWALHKHECSALQRWASSAPSSDVSVPSDAIRCIARILWTQQKEGFDSAWTREINLMQSHRSSLPSSSFESHTHIAHSLVRYLGVSSPLELEPFGLKSAGDLVDLISRFTTNTFTLTTSSLTPIGVSVCPTIALTNHSCEPNAVIVFPWTSSSPTTQEPLMHLVAIKDIEPDEEIVTAYIDTTLPRDLRQLQLKETYNFTCSCSLCTRQLKVDPRASVWCPKSCGRTCPAPTEENSHTRCVECNAVLSSTDAVLDALRVGKEALDKATALQYKDPAKAKQLTTNMIPILTSARLTPSCHPLLAMTRLHQELLIASLPTSLTQEVLDDTIRTAGKYSAGLSALLPGGHPVRGVALAELGKLLAVDEPAPRTDAPAQQNTFPPSGPARLKLAYETLVRAHDELVVGFGADNGGGQVGREVREAIVSLEKELGMWTQGIKNVLEDSQVKIPRS